MGWRKFQAGDKPYLSVVYKDYGGGYGGYYITFPEPGDLYIRVYDLGEPKVQRTMIERTYKDYTIVVSRVENNVGNGFRASFFIKKSDGSAACHQFYETYRRKTFKDTVSDVKKIIDTLG